MKNHRLYRTSLAYLTAHFAAALLLLGCASAPAISPTPDNCVTIRLWSNGWHANLAFQADTFEENHPIRELFPDKQFFLIGWGAKEFYMDEKPGFWTGLTAIIPPTKSTLHVIADDKPVEESLWRPHKMIEFAISETGAKAMGRKIAESLSYDDKGNPIILGEGRVAGVSYFLAAEENFHLFNMCNHWTARHLRESGIPLNPNLSFTAPALLKAVSQKTPPACPARMDEL